MKNIVIPSVLVVLALVALAGQALAGEKRGGGLIDAKKARDILDSDTGAVLLDVRTDGEFKDGHIAGSILLPYSDINEKTAAAVIPTKESTVIVYCRSGRRSSIAAGTLRNLGYSNVWDLGAIGDWPYGIVK